MKYDFLIVGAGYSGCVLAERISSALGKTSLLIDKRTHIGGNSHDYHDTHGILVHKYGPHLFHTKMKKVWDYLSGFTDWIDYEHKVLAKIGDKLVPVPFNLNSIESCFDEKKAAMLIEKLTSLYGAEVKIPILKLMETSDPDLKDLASFIYENVFLGYTVKQWGVRPEDLDFSVSSRVPVFISRDNRYFQDPYQGIPAEGYSAMFGRMTASPLIDVRLGTSFDDIKDSVDYNYLVYTGPLDGFFDYKYGRLPYRSLVFDLINHDTEYFQPGGQINFPNDFDYTRITEFKHFTMQKAESTTIAVEYPEEFAEGKNDPYYPIPNDDNHALFAKYKEEADKLENVFFIGRLANYKYYNMDETVGVALQLFEKTIRELDLE